MKLTDTGPVVEREPTKREAWEAMDYDQQQCLIDISESVKAIIEYAYIKAVKYIADAQLDSDELTALWTRFGSCDRSAMKRAQQK